MCYIVPTKFQFLAQRKYLSYFTYWTICLTLLKERLWHMCFPEDLLRTPFSQNTSERLLLTLGILACCFGIVLKKSKLRGLFKDSMCKILFRYIRAQNKIAKLLTASWRIMSLYRIGVHGNIECQNVNSFFEKRWIYRKRSAFLKPIRYHFFFSESTQQTFVLMKTSWRRLSSSSSEDVLKTSWSRPICSP